MSEFLKTAERRANAVPISLRDDQPSVGARGVRGTRETPASRIQSPPPRPLTLTLSRRERGP